MARSIALASIEAPWGSIRVAATGRGLAALEHRIPMAEFEARMESRFGPGSGSHDPARAERRAADANLEVALAALRRFIEGELGALDDLEVDIEDRPAWDRLVLGAVRTIPPGATASYGHVARLVDRPGAARAVGGAVSRNPVGLVIPCHRVIAGDGTIGGYGGAWWGARADNLALKQALLAREGVRIVVPAVPR